MPVITMRYGEMRMIGQFKSALTDLKIRERCVVKTERGTEIGTVVFSTCLSACPACADLPIQPAGQARPVEGEINPVRKTPDKGEIGNQGAPDDNRKLSNGVKTTAPAIPPKSEPPKEETAGEIIRRITPEDLKELGKIYNEKVPAEFAFCQQKIKDLKLEMKLAFVEHLLGGEKIIFYYLSEGRVDFRELVRELAQEYKTRIEMKQIGVRDEARLVGDYEHCGQELCCRTFLKELEPVTMKMAKNQKTTMDPAKISGRCGRLMCCLKYEDDMYLVLKNQLPKKSSRVQTVKGEGEVVELDILAQQIIIELDSKEKIRISPDEIIKTVKESTLKVEEDE